MTLLGGMGTYEGQKNRLAHTKIGGQEAEEFFISSPTPRDKYPTLPLRIQRILQPSSLNSIRLYTNS